MIPTTKPKVYVETTVISYLTARPSQDVIVAGHQLITHQWWQDCHERFELVASQLVEQEAGEGDQWVHINVRGRVDMALKMR